LAVTAGVPVVFDINVRPSLWATGDDASIAVAESLRAATLVKLSRDDALNLGLGADPQQAIDYMLGQGVPIVVVTDGERGSWFGSREVPAAEYVPAAPVVAVEPTGAGDAFTAALIVRLIENGWRAPGRSDVAYAAAAGALATTQPGAWPGLPSRAQLTEFLNNVQGV
jgi:fructokinase